MPNLTIHKNLKTTFQQAINSHLSLHMINEIPAIAIDHPKGKALISLQGAHLLSWQPHHSEQDVFWLSDIEPFKHNSAIRGGIPICYPWFKDGSQPSHGYARISLWQLTYWNDDEDAITVAFTLFDKQQLPEASIQMRFSDDCQIKFDHYAQAPAQAALHTYSRVSDIKQTALLNMPTSCLNTINNQQQQVTSPRYFSEETDAIYTFANQESLIQDTQWQRQISIAHQNNSDVVVWNPWDKATSNMTQEGAKHMLCVETARLSKLLQQGESMSVTISLKK